MGTTSVLATAALFAKTAAGMTSGCEFGVVKRPETRTARFYLSDVNALTCEVQGKRVDAVRAGRIGVKRDAVLQPFAPQKRAMMEVLPPRVGTKCRSPWKNERQR
jgi:hypothetical protein